MPWTHAIEKLNGEEIFGTFYEKGLQKTDQTEFKIEKLTKKKGYTLYVKCKSYDNLFDSWMIIRLTARLIKKISLYNVSYYTITQHQIVIVETK